MYDVFHLKLHEMYFHIWKKNQVGTPGLDLRWLKMVHDVFFSQIVFIYCSNEG